ncbi:spo0e like sporulation regulatory protein [Lucifera butyrica]|uniref:Spo0e like sporulation regulatory protein n=1 Tax=Lucifera butyrica TaxID=1351585 RepID=A0A498R3E1_9FIRM|nr:aspartyl-phosphate phosphatase Spo0E family protein [Lucifera butyrica]VBB05320.1 spo0e like sporulation regulatory protein [Lucifera butyrica]
MGDLEEKELEIEAMRLKLHRLVLTKKGNLADPEVAEYSAHLDKKIVDYEREKRAGRR